jgi:mono/diheme cytochrome c family protein
MRRVLRWCGRALLLVAVLIALVVLYVVLRFPRVSLAPSLTITPSAPLRARGAYLYQHLTACGACHSSRDWTTSTGIIVPQSDGAGGERFGVQEGVPGTIYAANITPGGIGSWTDGEIWRCLVSGVDQQGRALFPLMPYLHYRNLCNDDLLAIIVYLRSLPNVHTTIPRNHLLFPMNLLVRTIPGDAVPPSQHPSPADHVAYGRYLVTAAACSACHSPMHHGREIPEQVFSGGTVFPMGAFAVRSANLTPDDTGIGHWSRDSFIDRFLRGPEVQGVALGYCTPMPWWAYHGLTREDLGAIYDYLHALPPVVHVVTKVTPTP